MIFIKFSKFSQREFAKIWEEDFSFSLHLVLHINDLLLRGGDAEGVEGADKVLISISEYRKNYECVNMQRKFFHFSLFWPPTSATSAQKWSYGTLEMAKIFFFRKPPNNGPDFFSNLLVVRCGESSPELENSNHFCFYFE